MERRRGEQRGEFIASTLEETTGKSISIDKQRALIEGGSEIDLVRSGLEDIMKSAWNRISVEMKDQTEVKDIRTAAYVASIRRIAHAYEAIGI